MKPIICKIRVLVSILLVICIFISLPLTTHAITGPVDKYSTDATQITTKSESKPVLTVNATSNYFPNVSQQYDPTTKQVTVTYNMQSSKNMLDTQWYITYDPNVLSVADENTNKSVCPAINDSLVNFKFKDNYIKSCASNLGLYDFSEKTPFAKVVFDVKDQAFDESVSTTVNLVVEVLDLENVTLVNNAVINTDSDASAVKVDLSTELTPSACVVPTTTPADKAEYVVAGSEEFTGYSWVGTAADAPESVMTQDGDVFKKTFTSVPAGQNYQFKVVENLPTGELNWIGVGDSCSENFTFNVTKVCDVTVTYNPTTNKITATGDGVKLVTELDVQYITVVGNGDGNWLNDVTWKPADESNQMAEIADRIYQIKYEHVASSDEYYFKFAVNGNWAANWGAEEEGFVAPNGTDFDLSFNGKTMCLNTVKLGYDENVPVDITITLDLSDFNYSTKSGAKANIKVVPNDDHEHEYDVTIKTNATCTKEGLQEKICKVCGYKYSESISPLGHNYKSTVIEPTCTERGYTLHTCLRCSDTYKDNYVPALDHVYGEWLVKSDPACNSNGIKYRVCSVCSHEELAEIPATGHNYNSNIIKPTCTEKGYTVYTCSKCGDTYKDNFVKALGHVYDEWQVKSKPGCTSKGLKYRVCSVCSNEETAEIPAIGHTYDNSIIEPTCTEKGYTKHTCSACGDSYKDSYIDAKGHSYGEWIVDEAATVLSKGSKHRVCTECGHTETQMIAQIIVDINTDKNYGRANFTVVNAQTLEPIKNACIFISTEKDGENTFSTDSNGKVSIVLPVGKQTISVYADGCITRNTKITVKSGINDIPKIGLSEKPTYDAKLTSKPMTIEEIKDAGIDTSAPENQHVYKYELKLDFDPEIDTSSIISYFNSEGEYLGGYYAGDSTGDSGTAEPSDPTYNLHYHVVTGGIWHSWCKSIEVEKGQNVSLTYHPYRDDENYVFDGWYEDDSFTKKIYSTHIKDYSTYVYGRWIYVGEGEEQKISTNPGITIPTKNEVITVYPVSEHFYLIVRGEVKWLKEMFDVEMLVVNNSNTDTLENLTASLTLPKGLSLADMNGEQQTLDKKIDNIPEGKSESVHWYVRGDTAGSYNLKARLKGTIMPFEEDIDDTFVSENQLQVWAGNALNLHFDFPNAAYYGEDYPITITLTNVSDTTLYNINHIVQIEQGMEIYYSDGSKKEKIEKSSWKSIGLREFNPGDKIIIQTSTNIFFKSEIIENKLESLVGIVDGVEQLVNAYKALESAVDATESLISCVSGYSKALDKFDFTRATESTEKIELFKTLHQKVSGLMLSYSTSGNKTIDASVKLANTGINTSLNAITDNPDEWLKNNSVDDIKSLLTKIDALENSISESGATSRKFDIYDSIRTAISAIPIRFALSNVIMTEDENNTTSIPWSYSVSQSSAQYFGVSSVSKYLSSLTKATMGEIYDESMPWYLQLIPGLDDPFNQDEAIGYIKATENEITQFKAKDATGEVTFKAWVECNEPIQNTSTFSAVPLNSSSNFVLSSENKSATVGKNGVLTFKGDGMISVKPLSQTGGTLYIEDSEGNHYAYVIDVVAQHECIAGERETVIAPTKDYDGFAVKCCEICGDVQEIIPLSNEQICSEHRFNEWKTETEANCAEYGLRERICTVCGYTEYETINRIPHTEGEWKIVKEATANEEGEKQLACSVCGEVLKTETIPKLQHGIVIGDVNSDGIINAADVQLISDYLNNKNNLSNIQKLAADVNHDRIVDEKDQLLITQYANGEITDEYINQYIYLSDFAGDVNNDGRINIADATCIQRAVVQCLDLTELDLIVADLNSDGKIDIRDVTELQRYLVELVDSVSVSETTILPYSIKSEFDTLTLNVGETQKLNVVVLPKNLLYFDLTLSSDNESVATVDTNSVITAVGAGEAKISIKTENGLVATCKVLVSEKCDYTFVQNDDNTLTITGYTGTDTNIIIPSIIYGKKVKAIADNAFNNNDAITNIDISDGITSIGEKTFYSCSSLVSIDIPNSVTSIGEMAFIYCSNLKTVYFPNSIKSIGDCAFLYCTKLDIIDLSDSIEYIGESAFFDTGWSNKHPDGPAYFGKILYKYFGTCPDTVIIKDGITTMTDDAFINRTNLKRVILPNSLREIPKEAFLGCSNLESVEMSNRITAIRRCAFRGCTNLKNIVIPKSVTVIEDFALGYKDYYHKIQGFTIYGETGTAAEIYAKTNEFSFNG